MHSWRYRGLTSDKVHENSLDGWDSKHLIVILVTLREVLRETYVVPAQRKDRQQNVQRLRDELGSLGKSVSKENEELGNNAN